MKKIKRVLAMVGVLMLTGMYVAAFMSAFFKTPQAAVLFKASLAATVMVPVVIYAYTLVYRGIVERGVGRGDTENYDEKENGDILKVESEDDEDMKNKEKKKSQSKYIVK